MNFSDPVVIAYAFLSLLGLVFLAILLRVIFLSSKVPARVKHSQAPTSPDVVKPEQQLVDQQLPPAPPVHKRSEKSHFEKEPPWT